MTAYLVTTSADGLATEDLVHADRAAAVGEGRHLWWEFYELDEGRAPKLVAVFHNVRSIVRKDELDDSGHDADYGGDVHVLTIGSGGPG